jgi:hypothetical protein
MAYVNPRVRSFSQYLMSDDKPRRSKLNRYAGFESGLRTSKGARSPPTRRSGCRWPSRTTGVRTSSGASCARCGARTTVTIQVDPPGPQGWRSCKTARDHAAPGVYGPCASATARVSAIASAGALQRRAAARTDEPPTSVEDGRSSSWGLDPVRAQCERPIL